MWKVYVGNLDSHIRERDLADEFRAFGVVRSVWIARNPPGYAFVEFDDRRDADDAISSLDVMGGTAVISDAMTVVHPDILLGNVDPRVQETHIDAAQVPVTEQAAADTTPLEVHVIIADPLDVTTRVPLRRIDGATEIERNFNLQIDEATPVSILH